LVERWRQQLQAVPPFNQRPVLKRGRWDWQEGTDFELAYPQRHVALPQPGRSRELLSLVSRVSRVSRMSRVHGNRRDRNRNRNRNRPLWQADLICSDEAIAEPELALSQASPRPVSVIVVSKTPRRSTATN